jgi:acetyltransferase-like isoleucine patch superfamily enzyme
MRAAIKSIGRNVTLSRDTVLGSGVSVGNNVSVYPGVTIGADCTIFDGAILGRPPMTAGNANRELAPPGPLTIGAGSIIGANAVLYCGITIGARVMIGDLATIREGVALADDVVIGRGVLIMYETTVGARTRVIDGAILTGRMTIEPDVFIGPGVTSVNDNDVYLRRYGLAPFAVEGPVVRRFALLGTGSNIAAGVEVGEGALVAPSAMVTRDVPAWSVVAGVPARRVRAIAEADRRRILTRFGLEPRLEASRT